MNLYLLLIALVAVAVSLDAAPSDKSASNKHISPPPIIHSIEQFEGASGHTAKITPKAVLEVFNAFLSSKPGTFHLNKYDNPSFRRDYGTTTDEQLVCTFHYKLEKNQGEKWLEVFKMWYDQIVQFLHDHERKLKIKKWEYASGKLGYIEYPYDWSFKFILQNERWAEIRFVSA